jgi:NAD+ synthase (glutamine-hydrolysing)
MRNMSLENKNQKTDYGFMRVASVVPNVNVADVKYNVESIITNIGKAREAGAQLVAFPEMSITAYTCADLFVNELLLEDAEKAIETVKQATVNSDIIVIVGAPLRCDSHLFNCAVVIQNGVIMGVIPKTYIPNYKEFYEKRWFTTANLVKNTDSINVNGVRVPFGTDLLFDTGYAKIAVEICEDLWVPVPPSSIASINGANVIVNLSASNEIIGKHNYLVSMIQHQSNHCINAYVYSSAGYGESTTDLVFAGNAIIVENGTILKESKRFSTEPQIEIADVDIDALNNERRVNGSFTDNLYQFTRPYRTIAVPNQRLNYDKTPLLRKIKKLPFVPSDDLRLNSRCEEIINIVTEGLMRRLEFTHIHSLVIGISGGLDSTLALMVATRAFDRLGYNRKNINGVTMPGFGTTDRTYGNALALMGALGITVKEISIAAAVKQHFSDIGQNGENHDITYENSQARERTQILMDYANKINALVLGTGDLSELALGWATYNGDHMSMYNVNVGVPKTLAKHLIMWFSSSLETSNPNGVIIHETLLDVLSTPISPELTPADNNGNIEQKTEDILGPYELHDFFLYHILRYGCSPRKIYLLAKTAFKDEYDSKTIKKWLTSFSRRFFSQQFKRSCLPDGPKVGNVSLSPRGDWRMPSDASSSLWIAECENLPE